MSKTFQFIQFSQTVLSAGRALAGREHTELIRICVSLGSDKLVVTPVLRIPRSHGFFFHLITLPTPGAPAACVADTPFSSDLTTRECNAFKNAAN